MAMTIEQVREYADAVSRCGSPENVSRFNQAAGQWLYANLDAVAHLIQPAQAVDDGMLPDALVPHAEEWYRLCERRFSVDRMTISGELAEAIVKAIGQPRALSAEKAGLREPCLKPASDEVREAVQARVVDLFTASPTPDKE
jgi:hypothetical protein